MLRTLALFFVINLLALPAYATDVREIKSPAGIIYWLVEEHSQPLIATKIIFKNSGAAYDENGKEGTAAMTSALLSEGAGDMDAEAFGRLLENHAIRLGTSVDEDHFTAEMETLSEHKDTAFSALGLMLTQPRFDESAIARIKDQTHTALIQQESQPVDKLRRTWKAQIYGSHPYAKPELGTKETIEDLSKEDFLNYMNNAITRENIIIAIVGDINEKDASVLLDKNLSTLPEKQTVTALSESPFPAKGMVQKIAFDIPQTMVFFGTKGIKRNDPDYFSAYVMNYMLGGGGFASKLMNEVREKRGLAYSISTDLSPKPYAASWQGMFATRTEKADEAVEVVKTTLRDFVKNGPRDKELSDAKSFLTGSFVLGLDSNAAVANFLVSIQLNHLGIDYLNTRNARIEAVTKQGIHDMAKRLIDVDNLQIVMVGKSK